MAEGRNPWTALLRTANSQGASINEAELEAERKKLHQMSCPRCLGQTGAALCSEDPDYKTKARFLRAGLPETGGKTFQTFIMNRDNSVAAQACLRWAERPEGWLVLVGGKGTGKTHLLEAVVSARVGADQPAVYRQVGMLLDTLRGVFSRQDLDFSDVFLGWCQTAVLGLDDLGAEKPTDWAVERLTMLLDHRYGRGLPTLITTNLDAERMAVQLGSRIADRVHDSLTGLVHVYTLRGASHRTGQVW